MINRASRLGGSPPGLLSKRIRPEITSLVRISCLGSVTAWINGPSPSSFLKPLHLYNQAAPPPVFSSFLPDTKKIVLEPMLLTDIPTGRLVRALGALEINSSGLVHGQPWLVLNDRGELILLEQYKTSTLCFPQVDDDEMYEQLAPFTYSEREDASAGPVRWEDRYRFSCLPNNFYDVPGSWIKPVADPV